MQSIHHQSLLLTSCAKRIRWSRLIWSCDLICQRSTWKQISWLRNQYAPGWEGTLFFTMVQRCMHQCQLVQIQSVHISKSKIFKHSSTKSHASAINCRDSRKNSFEELITCPSPAPNRTALTGLLPTFQFLRRLNFANYSSKNRVGYIRGWGLCPSCRDSKHQNDGSFLVLKELSLL